MPFVIFCCGAAMVAAGAGLIFRPAGLIVAGVFLIYVSIKSMSGAKPE